jgi:pimeloyl-ACP methyl ester carboxylesterase
MRTAQEHRVRAGGLRIHVREVGEGAPVLLVNGLGAHAAMWAPVEEVLDGLRLIEFDAPGTGRTRSTIAPVPIPGLAWLATKVLDELGVARADVLGYSMGGIVAQQLAIAAPERVRRLVLVATTPGVGGVPGEAYAMLNVATPLRYWSPAFYAATIGGMVGGRARTDPQWVAEHGRLRRRSPPSAWGYAGQLMSIGTWTTLPMLHCIRHPVLVVTGDDDPLVPPANSYLLAHRLPHARLLLAPGEGHLLLMDPDSTALAGIHGFLQAGRPDDAPAWRDAAVVDDATVRAAIAGTRSPLQPLATVGALMRRAWPARAA